MKLLREPLVHFVALGALILVAQSLMAEDEPDARVITVSAERERALTTDFEKRRGKAPSADEFAGLVRRYVDEEILYREALARGMGQGDPVIRRRLVQQLSLVFEQAGIGDNPDDNDLRALLNASPERYAVPALFSFEHRFFSADKAGYERRADDDADTGDPFPLGRVLKGQTSVKLRQQFGADFAAAVGALKPGQWSAAIRSRLGLHRVRITHISKAAAPELADVKEAVLRDFSAERRKAAFKKALENLRGDYEVRRP
jgi:parvulin-like peptidyl-prolyl isomerase